MTVRILTGDAENDNSQAAVAISFSDLALLSGLDEDTLLHRIAAVLAKREDAPE